VSEVANIHGENMQRMWSERQPFTISGLLRWTLQFILRHPLIFWTCVVSNTIGAVVGTIWWYGPMLQQSPLWAYPFIPDCPLAAAGGTVALLGLRAGKRWPFVYALVAFACIKYGLWTLAFWARHWIGSGEILPIQVMLFVSHMGLLAEGLLFVPRIGSLSLPKRWWEIAWFAVSVFVDYTLNYHPPLGGTVVTREFVFAVAAGLTMLLSAGLLLLPRHEVRSAAPQAATA
jgi:uncharacterized membrane protein YpjA